MFELVPGTLFVLLTAAAALAQGNTAALLVLALGAAAGWFTFHPTLGRFAWWPAVGLFAIGFVVTTVGAL